MINKIQKRGLETVRSKGQRAFTLVELVTVIAIILILVGLLLPAIQHLREASRRTTCTSNQRNLGLAVLNFQTSRGHFPGHEVDYDYHLGFIYLLLPYLEQSPLFSEIDPKFSYNDDRNDNPARTIVPVLICPSDGVQFSPGERFGPTNYVGNAGVGFDVGGYNGVFAPGVTGLSPADLEDGMSNTAMISEALSSGEDYYLRWIFDSPRRFSPAEQDEFANYCRRNRIRSDSTDVFSRCATWMGPSLEQVHYNHFVEPGYPSCLNKNSVTLGSFPANSYHPGGVNVLFADGHTDFVANSIDLGVWRSLGSRNGIDR